MNVPTALPIPHPHKVLSSLKTSQEIGDEGDKALDMFERHSLICPEGRTAIVSPSMSITECPLIANLYLDRNKQTSRKCYQQLKIPWVILLLSSIQILVYVTIKEKHQKLFMFNPSQQQQIWRFVSYMFVHKDVFHLVQNVLLQTLFAIYMESFEGKLKVLCVYLGGGVGGAIGAAAVRSELLLGASAGVYALLLSYISFAFLRYRTLNVKHKIFLVLTVATIIAFDISYYSLHYIFNALPTISWGAHVFGALVGLLVGLIIYSNKWSCDEKKFNKLPTLIGVVLLLFVVVALIVADVKTTSSRREKNPALLVRN